MTLFVKCGGCGSEFRADVQMDPGSLEKASIDDFSQTCPFCGKSKQYSKSDITVKD